MVVDRELLECSFRHLPAAEVTPFGEGNPVLFDVSVDLCTNPGSIASGSAVKVKLRQNKEGQLVVSTNTESLNERFPENRRKRRRFNSYDTRLDLAVLDTPHAFEAELCSQCDRQQLPLVQVKGPLMTVSGDRVVVQFGMALIPNSRVIEHKHQALGIKFMAYLLQDMALVDPLNYTASPSDLLQVITRPQRQSETPEFPVPGLSASLMPYQRESVAWCLRKEGMTLNSEGEVEDLDPSIRDYVVSPVLGWRKTALNPDIWANPYTLRLSTDPKPLVQAGEYHGKGLLAEEMGLGKTIEMLSVLILNKRKVTDQYRIGTTLVICPKTILQQWVSEVKLHAPGLHTLVLEDPYTPVAELAAADIAFVTYAQLSKWFPFTATQKRRESRLSRFHFQEESLAIPQSSLVHVQFWRVILDEVQMVHTGDSSAAQTAQRIPRVHAWAVSGTPVKNSLEDMRGITKFLDLRPFVERPCWQRLIACSTDLQSLETIAIRHTRALVADQLHLTTQHRRLILLKFSSVERLRYNRLLADFEEDARNSNCNLSKWLLRLRQICSHTIAQPGHAQLAGGQALGTEVLPLTLDQVLTQLVEEADGDVWTEQSKKMNAQIELGQLQDKNDQIGQAIDIWKSVLNEVQGHLKALESREVAVAEKLAKCRERLDTINRELESRNASVEPGAAARSVEPEFAEPRSETDSIKLYSTKSNSIEPEHLGDAEIFDAHRNVTIASNRVKSLRLRHKSLQERLHRVYFFLGTGYFRASQRMKLKMSEEELKNNEQILEQNMQNEKMYYDLAEQVREELLKGAETKVLELRQDEQPLKLLNATKYCNCPKSKVVDKLSAFALEIIERLQEILGQPLMDERLTEKQEELGAGVQAESDAYSKTLDLQEYSFFYLDVLQVLFRDRAAAINGGNIQPSPTSTGEDKEFAKRLVERREDIVETLHYDREPLVTIMRETQTPLSVRTALQAEIRACQDQYTVLRDLYNARVDYYRQLQDLSDQVTDLDTGDKTVDFYRKIQGKKAEITRTEHRIEAKLKDQTYIRNLEGANHSATQKREDERESCTICLEPIVSGALTPCGHSFCVDCLISWLQARGTCPLCNRKVKVSEVHTFHEHDPNVKAETEEIKSDHDLTVGKSEGGDEEHASSLYIPISHRLYNEIHRIPLPRMYGIKIDMIVRHVLHLRSQDPTAQIVVFSQWVTMLKVLQSAFTENGIVFATTSRSNVGINEFRTDSRVACLLLHAKADVAGLTLVNANHVFLCEPLMNTALELQAVSRINRIGQTRETYAWQFCVENTVEQTILGMTTKARLLANDAESGLLAETPQVDRSSGAEVIGDKRALRKILFKSNERPIH